MFRFLSKCQSLTHLKRSALDSPTQICSSVPKLQSLVRNNGICSITTPTIQQLTTNVGNRINPRGFSQRLQGVRFMSLFPKRTKYTKYFKGRCSTGCKPDGTQLGFGRYGIKSCSSGRLSYRAIEAARRAIIGQFHRATGGQFRKNGKIWVRVFADIPVTGKPTEVRMGRGKGNPTGWIARVTPGQILFEMDGVSLPHAQQAATLAAHKLCLSTKFIQWS